MIDPQVSAQIALYFLSTNDMEAFDKQQTSNSVINNIFRDRSQEFSTSVTGVTGVTGLNVPHRNLLESPLSFKCQVRSASHCLNNIFVMHLGSEKEDKGTLVLRTSWSYNDPTQTVSAQTQTVSAPTQAVVSPEIFNNKPFSPKKSAMGNLGVINITGCKHRYVDAEKINIIVFEKKMNFFDLAITKNNDELVDILKTRLIIEISEDEIVISNQLNYNFCAIS